MLSRIRGKLIVSCQAAEGDAFRQAESMARFARAARDGGAAGIRANGAEDVRAVKQAVDLPVIAIDKQTWSDGRVLITPEFEGARRLKEAGAEMIALDATARGQRSGALERIQRIKRELKAVVLADIATAEEAVAAAQAGADAVLSTMRGYTAETAHVKRFEPKFIAELTRAVTIPVIAEGRIGTPEEAAQAMQAGAWAVIVGTAITRPGEIARGFVRAVESAITPGDVLGIDLGATNTKYGIVAPDGSLRGEGFMATPKGGREALLAHLKSIAGAWAAGVQAIGVSTAGWVDPGSGVVVYATDSLPGWTGARIADELRAATGLPVRVENDGHAHAAGEHRYGAARGVSDFVCLTLGTGVGGGAYAGGRLLRGAHFRGGAYGHIPLAEDGPPCTCGRKGCLEAYVRRAREAPRELAKALAAGAAAVIEVLDPELIVVGGGVALEHPQIVEALRAELEPRGPRVEASPLGYYAGVYGAAAILTS